MTANASHAGTGGNSWVYEIRGSSIYDLVSDQSISIFEAAERLNRNLLQADIWAAKAGGAEATNHALAAEVQRLRAALDAAAYELGRIALHYSIEEAEEAEKAARAALDASRGK